MRTLDYLPVRETKSRRISAIMLLLLRAGGINLQRKITTQSEIQGKERQKGHFHQLVQNLVMIRALLLIHILQIVFQIALIPLMMK